MGHLSREAAEGHRGVHQPALDSVSVFRLGTVLDPEAKLVHRIVLVSALVELTGWLWWVCLESPAIME